MSVSHTSRRRTGRVLAACVAATLLCAPLALAGCASSQEKAVETLTQGIQSDMDVLTALSGEAAAELFASDYTTELQAAGIDPAAVYGPLFENLSYKIGAVRVDGDQAAVTLTVVNKDLTSALQNYTATITNELATQAGRDALAALDSAALTRHMAEVLVACVSDSTIGTVERTVELSYVLQNGSWQLQDCAALTQALLGGLNVSSVDDPSAAQLALTQGAADANVASLGTQDPVADAAGSADPAA